MLSARNSTWRRMGWVRIHRNTRPGVTVMKFCLRAVALQSFLASAGLFSLLYEPAHFAQADCLNFR